MLYLQHINNSNCFMCLCSCPMSQMVALPKTYLRPISSAVVSQSQTLAAQNTTPVAFLPQVRSFQTSPVTRDIDSAAKFIGAGAATVGVAGSGKWNEHVRRFKRFQASALSSLITLAIQPSLSFVCVPAHRSKSGVRAWRSSSRQNGLVEILHLGHTHEYLVTHLHCLIKTPREGLRFGGASRV